MQNLVENFKNFRNIKKTTIDRKVRAINEFLDRHKKSRRDIISAKDILKWTEQSFKEDGLYTATTDRADTVLHKLYAIKDFVNYLQQDPSLHIINEGRERKVLLQQTETILLKNMGNYFEVFYSNNVYFMK